MRNEMVGTFPVFFYQGNTLPDNWLKQHGYKWEHLPTNQSGISKVATYTDKDFYKLLNYWNSQSETWRYSAI